MKRNAEKLEAVHTHTHTHTHRYNLIDIKKELKTSFINDINER